MRRLIALLLLVGLHAPATLEKAPKAGCAMCQRECCCARGSGLKAWARCPRESTPFLVTTDAPRVGVAAFRLSLSPLLKNAFSVITPNGRRPGFDRPPEEPPKSA